MTTHERKAKPKKTPKTATLAGTRLVKVRRVSRVNGRSGDSFLSPKEQDDRCNAYAARLGATIVESVDELDSVSGGSVKREGLERALELCDAGEADGIVVAKIDRFARTVVGGLTVIAQMEDRGHWLLSEREGVIVGDETATATDKLLRTLYLALAAWQRDTLAESWEAVRARKIAAGVHLAIPYGYKRGAGGRLVPEPSEAPHVQTMFTLRAEGKGWLAIAHAVNAAGAKPRRAEKFTHRSVHELVRVRTYLGEARSGEYVNANAHEPLVSEELWHAANSVVPRSHTRVRSGDSVNILAGTLRCAGCGQRMRAAWVTSKQRDKASASAQRYYRCKVNHSWGKCPTPASVNAAEADAYVVAHFLGKFADVAADGSEDSEAVTRAQAAVDAAREDLVTFTTSPAMLRLQRSEPELWEQGADARERALQDAREELEQALTVARGVALPADLASDWETISDEEKRGYLTDAYAMVVVRRSASYREPVAARALPIMRGQVNAPEVPPVSACSPIAVAA